MRTKLIIFGITGDLARRKLLPALSKVIMTGEFDELSIIGVSRREVAKQETLGDYHQHLSGTTSMFQMDLEDQKSYEHLKKYIDLKDDEQALFYMAVPPESANLIAHNLGVVGLNKPNCKLLFEKPFGMDYASAKTLIADTAQYFEEYQIYRIDHFMAQEMAQNILTFRSENALFAQVWDGRFIERIDIIASEKIGIEGRSQFYEQTGALRDILQSHLMQLLALMLMDVPADNDCGQEMTCRINALTHIKAADPQKSVRAQYDGYREDAKNPDSQVETYAKVELASSDPKWKDVPLNLITGKSLDAKYTEARVYFRRKHDSQTNCLTFRLRPNEGIVLDLYTRMPGFDDKFEVQQLKYTYPRDKELPEAYEHVLVEAIRSRKSLFTDSSEILSSWRILKPVQEAWEQNDVVLKTYKPGSRALDVLQ